VESLACRGNYRPVKPTLEVKLNGRVLLKDQGQKTYAFPKKRVVSARSTQKVELLLQLEISREKKERNNSGSIKRRAGETRIYGGHKRAQVDPKKGVALPSFRRQGNGFVDTA